jgi:uncharacterized protein
MSFEEFLMAVEDKSLAFFQGFSFENKVQDVVHEHLFSVLKHYFIVGGLPEAVATYINGSGSLFETFSLVRKKQSDLLDSYYADIAKHSGKVNARYIDRVLSSIPAQLSQVQDGSIAKFKFKGVVPGVTHYDRLSGAIDWLEAAGIAVKVHITNTGHLPFTAYSKESFFKLLMFDIGILGSMANLSPKSILEYDYGSYKGYFVENFVAQELTAAGICKLFSWHEKTAEVEFLVEVDGRVVPIEVKSGSVTKAKSLKIFSEKYSPDYQIVFSGRPFIVSKQKSTRYYPLYFTGKLPL